MFRCIVEGEVVNRRDIVGIETPSEGTGSIEISPYPMPGEDGKFDLQLVPAPPKNDTVDQGKGDEEDKEPLFDGSRNLPIPPAPIRRIGQPSPSVDG